MSYLVGQGALDGTSAATRSLGRRATSCLRPSALRLGSRSSHSVWTRSWGQATDSALKSGRNGGIFSLDLIHPNSQGYKLIADDQFFGITKTLQAELYKLPGQK
jgi:hypothetical protein